MQVLTRNINETKTIDPSLLLLEEKREAAKSKKDKDEIGKRIEAHLKDPARPMVEIGYMIPDQALRLQQDHMRFFRRLDVLRAIEEKDRTDEQHEEMLSLEADLRRLQRLLCACGVKGWKLTGKGGPIEFVYSETSADGMDGLGERKVKFASAESLDIIEINGWRHVIAKEVMAFNVLQEETRKKS